MLNTTPRTSTGQAARRTAAQWSVRVVVLSVLGSWMSVVSSGCARIEHRALSSERAAGGLSTLQSDTAERLATQVNVSSPAIDNAAGYGTEWFPESWPARWPMEPPRSTPGVIRSVDSITADLELEWLRHGRHLMPTDEDRADVAALLALGTPDAPPGFFRVEGPGSFNIVVTPTKVKVISDFKAGDVIEPELANQLMQGAVITLGQVDDFDPAREPTEVFRFISGVPETAPDGTTGIAIQRTWFAHYAPLDVATKKPIPSPRGVVVLIPGMFGTPQNLMQSTEQLFRTRGWHVLRMLVHPARMTERVELVIDADYASGAADIAELLDDRAAEAAYATRTALDHLASKHEGFGDLPHAVVGFSGGALLLPTTVAFDADRYDSAVIVAGGENALEILDTSNYSQWINALDIDWSRAGVPRGRVYDEYLVASKLDPAHTAQALAGKPVLVLHADADRAVPAASGERLWRRLGQPERWRFPFGHEFLFLGALPFNLNAVVTWLDEHTPIPEAGTNTPSESAR